MEDTTELMKAVKEFHDEVLSAINILMEKVENLEHRVTILEQTKGTVYGQIVSFIRIHPEFTLEELYKNIPANQNTIRSNLQRLIKSGKVKRIDKGKYILVSSL